MKYLLTISALLLSTVFGLAQTPNLESSTPSGKILDDSTKQIYSHKTTKFIFEKDITDNQGIYHRLDTSIFNIEYFAELDKRDKTYQDLGNNGTALNNLYFESPESIGLQNGFTSYAPYFIGPYDIRYYDTKSPFTNLNIVIGGRGRSFTEVNFSRNIKPNWNFGFDYRAITSDKQYQRSAKGDRQVTGIQYDFYSHYTSPNKKYVGFFNFSRNKHTVQENGGVNIAVVNGINDYFNENAETFLKNAQSQELRRQMHLYQEYSPKPILGLYLALDWDVTDNIFTDDLTQGDFDYYDQFLLDSTATNDKFIFSTFQAQTGVKGNAGLMHYNFYYKGRNIDASLANLPDSDSTKWQEFENYLGGTIRADIDSSFYIKGKAEYILGKNYLLEGMINRHRVQAGIKLIQSPPSLLQTEYYGNHSAWKNDFKNISTQEFWGSLGFNFRQHLFRPFGKYSLSTNYLYYNTELQPKQYTDVAQILTLGYEFNLFIGKRIGLAQTLIYASVDESAASILPIPKWMVNTKLFYHNELFNNNLELMIGLDTHMKSDFYGKAYAPDIQQFYNQNEFNIESYLNVDFFLNARIGQARMFVKMINLTQLFTGEGYFTTPYYPGQRSTLDFGVFWTFYD